MDQSGEFPRRNSRSTSFRPVVGAGPTAFENARIVKNRDAAGFHKTAPAVPVGFYAAFAVVAINHDQINRFLPVLNRFMAEFFEPHNLATQNSFLRPSARRAS